MKNTDTPEKILELLFSYPLRSFHLREISRLLNISPSSISRYLKDLKKQELIVVNDEKFVYEIKAKLDNPKFKNLKRAYNIKKLYDSGLLEYLKEHLPLMTIILFGSYSRGDDTEKSDIDIAIDGNEKKLKLDVYEKKLNRPINIEFINIKKITKELKNSLINGIVLEGYVSD